MNQVRRVFIYTGFDKTNGHLRREIAILTPKWGRFKYGNNFNWYSQFVTRR